jgi:hypothetical protein
MEKRLMMAEASYKSMKMKLLKEAPLSHFFEEGTDVCV